MKLLISLPTVLWQGHKKCFHLQKCIYLLYVEPPWCWYACWVVLSLLTKKWILQVFFLKNSRYFNKCTLLLWIDKWVWDTRRPFSALFLPYCKIECEGYKVLDSADRKNTYGMGNAACDNNMEEAWYRFTGAAGSKMPESSPNKNMCGTHAPGWLNGQHPSVAEGKVNWSHFLQQYTFFLGNSYKWTLASVWREIILGYFAMDIICSEKRMIFEERSFKKAVDIG